MKRGTLAAAVATAAAEPLVAMIAVAALLFAADAGLRDEEPRSGYGDDRRIEVGAEYVEALGRDYHARLGRPLTADEVRGAIDQSIDDEILLREAYLLGLDRGDPIVRRRLIQKMKWTHEALATVRPASPAELERWRQEHPERYTRGPGRRVRQVFLGNHERAAVKTLAALASPETDPSSLGLPLAVGHDLGWRPDSDLVDLFGEPFVDELGAREPGIWLGPIRSRFGWHIVWQADVRAAALRPLGEVRPQLESDLRRARRDAAVRRELARLRDQYDISVKWPADFEGAR